MAENIKFEELKAIIATYLPEDIAVGEIDRESHLINELNINSAHLVDIVLDVEDAFDIVLENEDMDNMQTVNDALAIIDQKMADK